MTKLEPISFHGGHSGEYCSHARDLLEDIILEYIRLGFSRVGISEHVPPVNDEFLYLDEQELNLTAADLNQRFEDYIHTLRRLKKKYAPRIQIFVGMETETYTGYVPHIKQLIQVFQPDYIVGSVHHVADICFDYSRQEYDRVASICGSIEAMYARYFDLQYEMIKTLKPFFVGHFDIIRIHDENYKERLLNPKINQRVRRNLELIKSLNLVMDYNLRPLAKGAKEPYITESILEQARQMGIRVVPGDDSHGVDQAGGYVDWAVKKLASLGFDIQWPDPVLLTP